MINKLIPAIFFLWVVLITTVSSWSAVQVYNLPTQEIQETIAVHDTTNQQVLRALQDLNLNLSWHSQTLARVAPDSLEAVRQEILALLEKQREAQTQPQTQE